MKKNPNLLLLGALALSAFATQAFAAPVITDWSTTYTTGTNGSASGTLVVGAQTVSVSYAGDIRDLQQNHTTIFNNAAYNGQQPTGQTVYTPNLPTSDAVGTWGTAGVVNTITFSKPVRNPILWIASLGRGGNWDAATYVQTWTFTSPFTLLSSWYVPHVINEPTNPYKMTQSGQSLIGQEGCGSIIFSGWYTSISWISDKAEQSAYFQVGYDTDMIDSGPQGPQGIPGVAGATGPQGPAGPAGAVGPAGPVGPAGAAGAVGPAGPVGPAGAAGAKGDKGDKGDTGAAGAPGAAGAQGPAGPAGPAGPQGPQGPKGDTGATGATGPQGLPGLQGIPGKSGNFPVYQNVTAARAAGVAVGQIWVQSSSGQVFQMVPKESEKDDDDKKGK